MKIAYALPVLCLLAAGCTTPKTILKNPQTGQVATCGGSAMGSMVGGVIGYHIQKSNDADCVSDYMSQGFSRVAGEAPAQAAAPAAPNAQAAPAAPVRPAPAPAVSGVDLPRR